jgi:hypothetical protein
MEPSLRYTWILRGLGREQEAAKLLQLVDGDFEAKRGTLFESSVPRQLDGALRAWLDGDRAETISLLRKYVDAGGRSSTLSMEPLWGELAGDSEFVSLMSEMENLVALERVKTIDLICNRNPIPDSWQPLTTTCTP